MSQLLSLQSAIDQFCVAGKQRGWSQGTAKQYRWHLVRFMEWMADRDIHTLDQITQNALRSWGASLGKRWSKATIRQANIAVRSFMKWCHKEGTASKRLAKTLKIPRVEKRIRRTILIAEFDQLIEACNQLPDRGTSQKSAHMVSIRNKAMMSLMYDALLRSFELCELKLENVNLEKRYLIVLGKGGNQETVGFGVETTQRIQEWLDVRSAEPGVVEVFVGVG